MGPSTAFSCDAAHARERMLIHNKPLPSASNQNLQILHGSVVQESIRLITVLQEEHEYLTRSSSAVSFIHGILHALVLLYESRFSKPSILPALPARQSSERRQRHSHEGRARYGKRGSGVCGIG
jgi:hypothetical protein